MILITRYEDLFLVEAFKTTFLTLLLSSKLKNTSRNKNKNKMMSLPETEKKKSLDARTAENYFVCKSPLRYNSSGLARSLEFGRRHISSRDGSWLRRKNDLYVITEENGHENN